MFPYMDKDGQGKNGNSDRPYFPGTKITVDYDCSHEIKRCLLLGRKAMTNLDSILKSRDITLPTKVHIVQAKVYPGVMYGCDSWTIKKAEPKELMLSVLEKTLESPLDSKEVNPEYLLEGLMLKLKLQYFGHLMQRADLLEKTLMLGKTEGRRRGDRRQDG